MENYDSFIQGLRDRGFVFKDNDEFSINSKGGCYTKDQNHFVLLTDGLVIYSTIPHHNDDWNYPYDFTKKWFWTNFQLEYLDVFMQMRNSANV